MSLPRLAGLVAIASLPLLLATLLLPAAHTVIVLVWLFGVLFLTWFVWNVAVRPLGELLAGLRVNAPLAAERKLHQLREEAARCREASAELEDLLDGVAGTLETGLIVVDPAYRVRMINQAALGFLGREQVAPGSLLVESLRDPEVLARVQRAVEAGEEGRITIEHRRGLWDIRSLPVRRGGAAILLAEVTLIRRSADLRRRFIQDLSHELRSPLAVLRTAVESLEGDVDPEQAAVLVRQVERITRLAEELRELATIESGELELDPEVLVVADLVEDVVRDLDPVAGRAGVELRSRVPAGLELKADRRALRRVLSNLVDNAIKYNRRGGWVEIGAGSTEGIVRLHVADSGEGIPAPEVQAIFQRFYRVERGRTPGRGGLGLGLAIVKHLVRRMGGALHMDSREGVGTTVEVALPKDGPASAGGTSANV